MTELRDLEEFHRKRLREMNETLTYLRQAVEVVTVALESDADLDLSQVKPKVKVRRYLIKDIKATN